MQKQGYDTTHIKAGIANTREEGKSFAPQRPPWTGEVIRLFESRTAERPPLSAKRSKRPPTTETFRRSVAAAPPKARQIIGETRPAGYTKIVEGWQQLADGNVQFTIRTLL